MAQKDASVAELTKNFEDSNAVLLTEYRGLTVAQLKQLRNSIRQDAEYAVVKNTLTKIAANNAGITSLDDDLKGPSAIAFVHGDFVATAKALRDFAKANPLLVIKGGVFEGNSLSADEVNKYASLESREVLLAKAAGMMKATMGKAPRPSTRFAKSWRPPRPRERPAISSHNPIYLGDTSWRSSPLRNCFSSSPTSPSSSSASS
nr:hypothetical protein GCM10025699_01100 [Microbacterium flavescens]